MSFYKQAVGQRTQLVQRRRDFHRHPELGFQEVRTSNIITQTLTDLGLEVQTGIAKTGVAALLEGSAEGPTVMIRADMDALPIKEENVTDYISENEGIMHACGHDGHMSVALTVADLLTRQRQNLNGRVLFVFQPAEEGGNGALEMLNAGLFDVIKPDVVLGLHLWNELPVGTIAITPGPFMAAAGVFECTIQGTGGHGAQPHLTVDPIVSVAQIISGLQSIVSRNVDPRETAVVTVGKVRSGDTFNVIPSTVRLSGTFRSFDEHNQILIAKRIEQICDQITAANQCTVDLSIEHAVPAVMNNESVSIQVAEAAASRVDGVMSILDDFRVMASEDVGLFLQEVPGCYFFVGSANPLQPQSAYAHHHPRFDLDEDALPLAAAVMAEAAASWLIT